MRILVATNNKGKVVEFKRILEPIGFEVITPGQLDISGEVEETGVTFAENSMLKASALFDQTGIPTIADDSGMAVDILDGRPGVYTARYGGEEIDYPEKFKLLFAELDGVEKEKRKARFICSICCILDKESIIEVEGTCEGYIGFEPQGDDGFGFDPIFYVDGDKSFSQLSPQEKDDISHRGKALRSFATKLKEKINEDVL